MLRYVLLSLLVGCTVVVDVDAVIDCNTADVCKHGGSCTGETNGVCTCAAGYTGPTCETDIDECAGHPCKNSATCANQVNKYTCTCVAEWTGTTCEKASFGACTGSGNNAACPGEITNGECVGSKCACKSGFHAKDKKCVKTVINCTTTDVCKHGGSCTGGANGVCTCAAGYTGPTCETDIDECAGNPCKNGGTCAHQVNKYTCTCVAAWTGTTCEKVSLGACTGSGDNAACPGEITNGECVGSKCACKSGYHAEDKKCVKDPDNSATTNGLTIACTLAALTFAVIQKLF